MQEIEITDTPELAPDQCWSLDMHSVINVFNVLRCELSVVGVVLNGDGELIKEGLTQCDRFLADLKPPANALDTARNIRLYTGAIMADVERARRQFPGNRDHQDVLDAIDNLRSIFDVLAVRAQELIDRASCADHWVEHSIEQLRQNFESVFQAIEKNSHGRYRIIYNAALGGATTYYVDFKLEADGDRLWMPPVFQDVMRDLIANARKYTRPGGRITAALHENSEMLRFVVEDTGRGIPADEIRRVFEFGHRASNTYDVRTMGGGFGLTKALVVTKRFGGRFWIASELGAGTRIRIHLPRASGPEFHI